MHGENIEWYNACRTFAPGQMDANNHGTIQAYLRALFLPILVGLSLASLIHVFVHREALRASRFRY